jgi:hypothetical protein
MRQACGDFDLHRELRKSSSECGSPVLQWVDAAEATDDGPDIDQALHIVDARSASSASPFQNGRSRC